MNKTNIFDDWDFNSNSESETPPEKKIVTSICNCARCGQNHENLIFYKFTRPSGEYTHYAYCPTNGEPILMKIILTS